MIQWEDVTKQLPESGSEVDVYDTEFDRVTDAHYDGVFFAFFPRHDDPEEFEKIILGNVTHWTYIDLPEEI